jgi:hypothetical protein
MPPETREAGTDRRKQMEDRFEIRDGEGDVIAEADTFDNARRAARTLILSDGVRSVEIFDTAKGASYPALSIFTTIYNPDSPLSTNGVEVVEKTGAHANYARGR